MKFKTMIVEVPIPRFQIGDRIRLCSGFQSMQLGKAGGATGTILRARCGLNIDGLDTGSGLSITTRKRQTEYVVELDDGRKISSTYEMDIEAANE